VTTSFVAVTGNSLVIYIIIFKRMRTVTNMYIANLAMADVIIGLLAIPFQFQAILLQRWTLPAFLCKFCPFVSSLSVNVSVLTLVMISIDRFKGITRPLSHRPRKRHTKMILLSVWLASLLFASPLLIFYTFDIVDQDDVKTPFCFISDSASYQLWYRVYSCVSVTVQYLLPLAVISSTYMTVSSRLWWSGPPPGQADMARDKKHLLNRRKVVRMLMMVVLIFSLCWLPYHLYFIVSMWRPDINNYKYINLIFLLSHWLAMSNSCYNPFIYCLCSSVFRHDLSSLLWWRHCPVTRGDSQEETANTNLLSLQVSVL